MRGIYRKALNVLCVGVIISSPILTINKISNIVLAEKTESSISNSQQSVESSHGNSISNKSEVSSSSVVENNDGSKTVLKTDDSKYESQNISEENMLNDLNKNEKKTTKSIKGNIIATQISKDEQGYINFYFNIRSAQSKRLKDSVLDLNILLGNKFDNILDLYQEINGKEVPIEKNNGKYQLISSEEDVYNIHIRVSENTNQIQESSEKIPVEERLENPYAIAVLPQIAANEETYRLGSSDKYEFLYEPSEVMSLTTNSSLKADIDVNGDRVTTSDYIGLGDPGVPLNTADRTTPYHLHNSSIATANIEAMNDTGNSVALKKFTGNLDPNLINLTKFQNTPISNSSIKIIDSSGNVVQTFTAQQYNLKVLESAVSGTSQYKPTGEFTITPLSTTPISIPNGGKLLLEFKFKAADGLRNGASKTDTTTPTPTIRTLTKLDYSFETAATDKVSGSKQFWSGNALPTFKMSTTKPINSTDTKTFILKNFSDIPVLYTYSDPDAKDKEMRLKLHWQRTNGNSTLFPIFGSSKTTYLENSYDDGYFELDNQPISGNVLNDYSNRKIINRKTDDPSYPRYQVSTDFLNPHNTFANIKVEGQYSFDIYGSITDGDNDNSGKDQQLAVHGEDDPSLVYTKNYYWKYRKKDLSDNGAPMPRMNHMTLAISDIAATDGIPVGNDNSYAPTVRTNDRDTVFKYIYAKYGEGKRNIVISNADDIQLFDKEGNPSGILPKDRYRFKYNDGQVVNFEDFKLKSNQLYDFDQNHGILLTLSKSDPTAYFKYGSDGAMIKNSTIQFDVVAGV